MNRWLILLMVPVAALALGAAIVPTSLEQAYMFLRDQDFAQATDTFESRWNRGDHSREVANALSELYIRQGHPGKAADVLVTYITAHPKDTAALERLAQMFRDDQRRDKYIATVEQLYRTQKDTNLLRSLEKLYELAGREEDRIKALTTLVRSASAELSDHVTLAELLSAREPTKALEILFNAFKRWPKSVTTTTAQTFTVLAAENERNDLITAVVMPWLATRNTFAEIEPVIVALVSQRLDSLALQLVLASKPLSKSDPQTVVLAARLEAKSRLFEPAFKRLEILRLEKKLPSKGDDVYIETALLTGNRPLALQHVLSRGPAALPFWLQTWFIAKIGESGDTDAFETLKERFSDSVTPSARFLCARIELATGNKERAISLALKAKEGVSDVSSAIAVAGLLADVGEPDQARALMHQYAPDPDHVPVDELPQAVTVALVLKDERLALAMAQVLKDARPGTTTDILYARALGLNGQADQALQILDEIENWGEAKELATFEILKAAGRTSALQALLFERLTSEDSTILQRNNYVFQLNDFKAFSASPSSDAADLIADDLDSEAMQGSPRLSRIELLGKINPTQALPYAREAAENDPEASAYLYLALLKKLGRNADAVAFFESTIADIENDRTKHAFLHDWIAAGITRGALPYLKELAEGSDRQWFYAYDEALKKLADRPTRLQFLSNYSKRSDVDAVFKGQLASEILEAGGKNAAIALLMDEAALAPPKSKEVEQLLHLWGPRPPQAGIDWLEKRASQAPKSDRIAWLGRLLDVAAVEEASRLGATWYADGDKSITATLAASFEAQKRKPELRALLVSELSRTDLPPETAAKLAQSAEALGLLTEASQLFEIASRADAKWLTAAGRTALYAGQKSRAVLLLSNPKLEHRKDLELTFLKAEALYFDNNKTEALRLYNDYLKLMTPQSRTSAAFEKYKLIALVRLGRLEEAEALVRTSKTSGLAMDFAALLMDSGHVERAAKFLPQHADR